MFNNLKKALGSFVSDISSTEVAVINESEQQIIMYSKIEIEGDQLSFVSENVKPEMIELQKTITHTAIQSRMTVIKMAGVVLDAIKPI